MSEPSLSDWAPAPSLCDWCKAPLPPGWRGRFHGRKCRQAAWRLRRRRTTDERAGEPGRFAYADPPYPGLAKRYYEGEASYAGEVDHEGLCKALVAVTLPGPTPAEWQDFVRLYQLEGVRLTGFAISTSVAALGSVLALLPPYPMTRTCAWVKPIAPAPLTYGLHNTWEPLLVVGGRRQRPGKRDWLSAQPARLGGSELMGRKPLAFCAFLFDALGMRPGDELVDLFQGSGAVTRAWAEAGRVAHDGVSDASAIAADDASRPGATDAAACDEEGHTKPGSCSVCGDHACMITDGRPLVIACEVCKTACPCECGRVLCGAC